MRADITNWKLAIWTDAEGETVKRLACHVSDLASALDLPFPPRAVMREAVTDLPVKWGDNTCFFRHKVPCSVGDCFEETINQSSRPCVVIAVDHETGGFLYEYAMPGGGTFLRDHTGKPLSRNNLTARWKRILGNPAEAVEDR